MRRNKPTRYLRINQLLKYIRKLDVASHWDIVNDLLSVLFCKASTVSSDSICSSMRRYSYEPHFSPKTDVKAFDLYTYEADTVFRLYSVLYRIHPQPKVHELLHQLSEVRPDFFANGYVHTRYFGSGSDSDSDCECNWDSDSDSGWYDGPVNNYLSPIVKYGNAEEILFWLDHFKSFNFFAYSISTICHRSYSAITSPDKLLQPADTHLILQRILGSKSVHYFQFDKCLHPAASDAEIELVADCFCKYREVVCRIPSYEFEQIQTDIYNMICNRRQMSNLRPDFSLFYSLMQKASGWNHKTVLTMLFHELRNYEKYVDAKKKQAVIDQMIDFTRVALQFCPEAPIRFSLLLSRRICTFLAETKIHPGALFPQAYLRLGNYGSLGFTILPYIIGPDDYSINILDNDRTYVRYPSRIYSDPTITHLKRYGRLYDHDTADLLSNICAYVHHPLPEHTQSSQADRFRALYDIFCDVYRAVYE